MANRFIWIFISIGQVTGPQLFHRLGTPDKCTDAQVEMKTVERPCAFVLWSPLEGFPSGPPQSYDSLVAFDGLLSLDFPNPGE
jgi:hypothetical protein